MDALMISQGKLTGPRSETFLSSSVVFSLKCVTLLRTALFSEETSGSEKFYNAAQICLIT